MSYRDGNGDKPKSDLSGFYTYAFVCFIVVYFVGWAALAFNKALSRGRSATPAATVTNTLALTNAGELFLLDTSSFEFPSGEDQEGIAFKLTHNGTNIVTITSGGEVILGREPSEAARIFWDEVSEWAKRDRRQSGQGQNLNQSSVDAMSAK